MRFTAPKTVYLVNKGTIQLNSTHPPSITFRLQNTQEKLMADISWEEAFERKHAPAMN